MTLIFNQEMLYFQQTRNKYNTPNVHELEGGGIDVIQERNLTNILFLK